MPDFGVGMIVGFPTAGALTVGFPMAGVFIVALGMAAFIVGVAIFAAIGLTVGVTIFVAIGFNAGTAVAAIDMAVAAIMNDARTSSAKATLNILIPVPPQYPLCRTTHQ
jgi:hypothetical protein